MVQSDKYNVFKKKYKITKEALKNLAKENEYYNQTTALLITIKRVHEKESQLYTRLCDVYQMQRDSYKNSGGKLGSEINYRSSGGSQRVPAYNVEVEDLAMKSFRSRERSNSWGSQDLVQKSVRKEGSPRSSIGSAFLNMTKKSV